MKNFNSLQDLWNYCLYCPICQDFTRTIEPIIGPEDVYRLISYQKKNHLLDLRIKAKDADSLVHKYEVIIDCSSNEFIIHKKYDYSPQVDVFYLYLFSNCDNCDSHVNTSDIDFNLLSNKLEEISLDQEGNNLLNGKHKYNVIADYSSNCLIISKLSVSKDGNLSISKNHAILPLIDLDYTDQSVVSQKITNLLIFS